MTLRVSGGIFFERGNIPPPTGVFKVKSAFQNPVAYFDSAIRDSLKAE